MSDDKKSSLSGLSLSIIMSSIYSTQFLDSNRKYLDPKAFTNGTTRLIIEAILNYYDDKEKAPFHVISDVVNSYGLKQNKSQKLIDDANAVILESLALFNSGYLKNLDLSYISDRIIEYSYATKFQALIPELHNLSEKNNIDAISQKLTAYIDEYKTAKSLKEEDDIIYGGKESLIEDLYQNNTTISNEFTYGIKILDDLGIRPIRKKKTGLIGYYGRGKSQFLIHMTCVNALDPTYNKKVLIINGEQKSVDIFKKIIQNFYGVNELVAEHYYFTFIKPNKKNYQSVEYKRELLVNKLDLNTELNKLIELHKDNLHLFKNIIIQSFKSKSITVQAIKDTLKKIKRDYDFEPDMIAIDHLCEIKIENSRDERKELELFMSNSGNIADEYNVHMIYLQQPSSVNPVPDYLTWNLHSAENKGLARMLDVAMTLNVTDAESSLGLGRIFIEKVKLPNGQLVTGKKILVSQISTLQRFCVDSYELSKGNIYDIDSPLEEETNQEEDF